MDISTIANPEVFRVIGVLGFIAYVLTYAALSVGWLSGESIAYFAGNTAAAMMVLISLVHDFNIASVLIQVFWIGIGLGAILLRLRRGFRPRTA